ncbi:hypothetical protein [Bartonella sp. AS69XJJH]|uniref:hypothetical protein n=1 Tax=Bartonella sp. AS69XJJH TaxID=3243508 RepID=UPI0035CE9429
MPENFESDYDFAIDKGLTYDEALLELERFTNYWIANPSKNANKRDWQRTWYNCVTSPIGMLAKKLEKEKQAGGNNGNFSKNQRIRGGTGETIRNLINEAGFSESTSKHCHQMAQCVTRDCL